MQHTGDEGAVDKAHDKANLLEHVAVVGKACVRKHAEMESGYLKRLVAKEASVMLVRRCFCVVEKCDGGRS